MRPRPRDRERGLDLRALALSPLESLDLEAPLSGNSTSRPWEGFRARGPHKWGLSLEALAGVSASRPPYAGSWPRGPRRGASTLRPQARSRPRGSRSRDPRARPWPRDREWGLDLEVPHPPGAVLVTRPRGGSSVASTSRRASAPMPQRRSPPRLGCRPETVP